MKSSGGIKKIVSPTSQITQLKKEKFIDAYTKLFGHISDSCRAAGISRKTYYNWLDSDPKFLVLVMDAEMDLNDDIRDVLIKKAAEGDMTAVIFYLKNRHADFKQKDNFTAVQINFNKLSDEQKEKYGI